MIVILQTQAIQTLDQVRAFVGCPVANAIGERRKPVPKGRPGYLRVDCVHQGDLDGIKGVYLINAVDEVTQCQCICAVERISEAFLLPVLAAMMAAFPFVIRGFHGDNGTHERSKGKIVSTHQQSPTTRRLTQFHFSNYSGPCPNWKILVRDGAVRVRAVYLTIGVTLVGEKEVLGMWLAQTEVPSSGVPLILFAPTLTQVLAHIFEIDSTNPGLGPRGVFR